jgi:hypothetical protein
MPVSGEAHLQVPRQPDQPAVKNTRASRRRQASPGRYMVRSGCVYLFQIKVPKEIIADRPFIRASLGARPYRQARWLADLMAAEARLIFGKTGRNEWRVKTRMKMTSLSNSSSPATARPRRSLKCGLSEGLQGDRRARGSVAAARSGADDCRSSRPRAPLPRTAGRKIRAAIQYIDHREC